MLVDDDVGWGQSVVYVCERRKTDSKSKKQNKRIVQCLRSIIYHLFLIQFVYRPHDTQNWKPSIACYQINHSNITVTQKSHEAAKVRDGNASVTEPYSSGSQPILNFEISYNIKNIYTK